MTEDKKIFTTPKVRKFARELGANIDQIQGSERKGRISEEDVKNFVNNKLNQSKDTIESKMEFNHSDFGEVEIKDKTFSVSLYSDLTQITFVNIILEDLNNRE